MLSYSSYDAQNLSAADLDTTLDYIHAHISTNRAGSAPEPRMWIGEYGRGGDSTDAQEPFNRGYIQRLLNWNYNGQVFPFILYWEMYDNEPGLNYCLINSNDVKVASWYLQHYYFNAARLAVAQFKETNARLPTDPEFVGLVSPMLNQPFSAPVELTVANGAATVSTNLSATISGTVGQGIYGDDEAAVFVYYGRQDMGASRIGWESARFLGLNTQFNPATFSTTITNLAANTNYYFRLFAFNENTNVWSPSTAQFSTVVLNAGNFGTRMKISFSGYNRNEILNNFPVLVNLGTSLPGFSYHQFASPNGGDLRFADASGSTPIPHEIDEWNTNGVSSVWVNVPQIGPGNNFIWAYWGNAAATNLPPASTNGSVWPGYDLVWHLKETAFPFADSTSQWPANGGVLPAQTSGVIGHGENFNGTTTYLDAGAVNDLGGAFTLSAWVDISSSANNIQTLWANQKGGFGSAGFALFVNSFNTTDGKVLLDSGDGSTGKETASSAGVVPANQWHLVSAEVNRTNGTVAYYVDGTAVGGGAAATDFINNADLNLGRFTNGSFPFKGTMDEARIQSGNPSSNWIWASWMTVASNTVLANYSTLIRPQPALAITGETANGLLLTWPESAAGYGLFSAPNLTPPVVWSPVTNTPVWVNNQWQLTLPPGGATGRFYRLQSQ